MAARVSLRETEAVIIRGLTFCEQCERSGRCSCVGRAPWTRTSARAEEAFNEQPVPNAPATRLDKTLRILTWPAYSLTPKYAMLRKTTRSSEERKNSSWPATPRIPSRCDDDRAGHPQGSRIRPDEHRVWQQQPRWSHRFDDRLGTRFLLLVGHRASLVRTHPLSQGSAHRRIAGGAALTGFRVKIVSANVAVPEVVPLRSRSGKEKPRRRMRRGFFSGAGEPKAVGPTAGG